MSRKKLRHCIINLCKAKNLSQIDQTTIVGVSFAQICICETKLFHLPGAVCKKFQTC